VVEGVPVVVTWLLQGVATYQRASQIAYDSYDAQG
jgi:hypothetical protein